jgi:Mg-chelatase subunit ChlD
MNWETGTGAGVRLVKFGKGYETTPSYGERILQSMDAPQSKPIGIKLNKTTRTVGGGGYNGSKRTRFISSSRGRYVSYQIPKGKPKDLALIPTIRVAATHQKDQRPKIPKMRIEPKDIRVKVREYSPRFTIVLLVDMSLSMIGSMEKLAQAIQSLHRDVYRRRDKVGLIIFKGAKAYTIQHPTTNLDLVLKKLKEVGASDFTPMPEGLLEALKTLKREKLKNREAVSHLIIISDGIVNVSLEVPLSPMSRRRYSSEAQADSLDVARLIRTEGFKVHVVNTSHSDDPLPELEEGYRIRFTPTQFLVELARISGGTYKGFNLNGEATI